jgi:hypothetical protein
MKREAGTWQSCLVPLLLLVVVLLRGAWTNFGFVVSLITICRKLVVQCFERLYLDVVDSTS